MTQNVLHTTREINTAIDITLVNYYALNSGFISNWMHRDDDFTLSDHDRLDMDINTSPVIEQVYCRNFTKMDWRLFRLLLDEKLAEVAEDADADSLLDHLYTSIESALDTTAPYGLRRVNCKTTWWNDDLDAQMRRFRHFALKKNKNPHEKATYKKLKFEYTRNIEQAKNDSFKTYCTKLSNPQDIVKLVKSTSKSKAPTSLLSQNGVLAANFQESHQIMLEAHFPQNRPVTALPTPVPRPNVPMDQYTTDLIGLIDARHVHHALLSFGSNKAPGPDDIRPRVLQNLTLDAYSSIASMYTLNT